MRSIIHERLMRAVEEGDIEVIDMWEEGDGQQDNTFVKRKALKVLMQHDRKTPNQMTGKRLINA